MHQKIKLTDYQKFFIFKLRPEDYKDIIYFMENYIYMLKENEIYKL